MTRTTTRPLPEGGASYALLLPPGWWHVPLETAAARRSVKRLLDDAFARMPRDRVATLRHELEREMRALVARAVDAGSVDLWMLAQPVRGLPVTASLTTTVVPAVGDRAGVAAGLAGPGVEQVEPVLLPAGPAVRRLRRTGPLASPPPGEAERTLAEATPEATVVEYLLDVPDARDALLLSFSTTSAPVADALVAVFDAVAESLEWRLPSAP